MHFQGSAWIERFFMKKEKTISACFWNKIPDSIPIHFDAAGIADQYGSKGSLVFEPILGLMLLGLFALIENFPQSWNLPVPKDTENQDKGKYACLACLSDYDFDFWISWNRNL